MQYSQNDVKPIIAKDAIKKRPDMYFGARGINAEDICTEVLRGALVLGATDVSVTIRNEWWFICGDSDWLNAKVAMSEINETSIFRSIYAFPELAANSFRWEALTNYFSDATYTTSAMGTVTVLDDENLRLEYDEHIRDIGSWARIIGFKFNKDA